MNKHSPGPWTRTKHGDLLDTYGQPVRFRSMTTLCSGSRESIDQAEANTKIADAGAELLEALEQCAKRFRQYELHHARKPDLEKATANAEMAMIAEAAIAKARGES